MFNNAIETLISACEWDTTNFLIVSENVFDPLIYYSHIVPIVVSLTVGFFVLYKNPKLLHTRILFTITLLFSLWAFFDLILWATDRPDYTIFFWSIVNLIEPFIYASGLYFVQVFIHNRDTSLPSKIGVFLPLLPFVLLIPTKFTLLGYDLTNCNREAIEGPLTHYAYLVEIFYMLWIALFSVRSYQKAPGKTQRKKILLIGVGIILFLLTFSSGNIIGSLTDDWRLPQWGLFGMPVFVAFLSYLIVKYNEFDIKLIATQALAVVISVLVGSQFFFIKTPANRLLNGITLVITVIGGMLLVRSVKKEVALREQLQVANDKLRELDKQKTEFLSIASHQLRAPLTAIKGYSSMILEGSFGEVGEKVRGAVDVVFQSSQKLVTVIEDFLNITRIELGKMKYEMAEMDLRQMTEMVIREQSHQVEARGLKLSFQAEEGLDYKVTADSGKISQVVTNLIDNAIKYTKQGEIKVSLMRTNTGKVRLAVQDTGVGLTPDAASHLFEKFTRAPDAGKVNIVGTGLGLYVAKQIVEAHKGKIWAESAGPGQGSTFVVEI